MLEKKSDATMDNQQRSAQGSFLGECSETYTGCIICRKLANNEDIVQPSCESTGSSVDELWATDLPTQEEREEIFGIHLRKRGRNPKSFKVALLATAADSYTGAEIEACIEDAMFAAFDQGNEVNTKHILQAIKETKPQAERDREEVTRIREWCSTRARLVGGDPIKQKPIKAITTRQRLIHPKKGVTHGKK